MMNSAINTQNRLVPEDTRSDAAKAGTCARKLVAIRWQRHLRAPGDSARQICRGPIFDARVASLRPIAEARAAKYICEPTQAECKHVYLTFTRRTGDHQQITNCRHFLTVAISSNAWLKSRNCPQHACRCTR